MIAGGATVRQFVPPQSPWTPPPVPPYQPPAPRWGIGRWLTLVAAILVSILAGIAGAEGAPGAEGAGMATGGALVPFTMAALFLVWTRRTRSYIPFAALGLAVMSLIGQLSGHRQEVDSEVSQTHAQLNALLDTTGDLVAPSASSRPPTSQDGKMIWALNQTLGEVSAHRAMIAAKHGIDPDSLPPAWGTAQYQANAASHPEVGRYWTAYRSFLAEYRTAYPAWLRARLGHHARVAGLRADVLRGFERGVAEGSTAQAEEIYSLNDATAAAALEFHRFLVSVDARVQYDAESGRAMFTREADLARANELEGRVNTAAAALTRAQEANRQRGRARIDSLATTLR